MYLIIQCLDFIKVTVGFIILRSGIWCKKFVSDGTIRVDGVGDAKQTGGEGDFAGAIVLNANDTQNGETSPEAWLVENVEPEPSTVVEAENDFLDKQKAKDLL